MPSDGTRPCSIPTDHQALLNPHFPQTTSSGPALKVDREKSREKGGSGERYREPALF